MQYIFNNPRIDMDSVIVREIQYCPESNVFIDATNELGVDIIGNIYTQILPSHIELFLYTLEDLVIKDRDGKLTLLTASYLVGT